MTTRAYIGRKACGCVVAATVQAEGKGNVALVAQDVSRFIRDGLTVELVTVDEARRLLKRCAHGKEGA